MAVREKPQTAFFLILINDRRIVFIFPNCKFSIFSQIFRTKRVEIKIELNFSSRNTTQS